jgi:hypothetical protein
MLLAHLPQRIRNALRRAVRRVLPHAQRVWLRTHIPWLNIRSRAAPPAPGNYAQRLQREATYWGRQVAGKDADLAWLEHPLIRALYVDKRQIDGMDWPEWLVFHFGSNGGRAIELGSGTTDGDCSSSALSAP